MNFDYEIKCIRNVSIGDEEVGGGEIFDNLHLRGLNY